MTPSSVSAQAPGCKRKTVKGVFAEATKTTLPIQPLVAFVSHLIRRSQFKKEKTLK